MEIRRMKLSELKPADYNPRVELKPGDPEYDALKISLETDGVVVPIVWNEETGNIVSGHQRLKVLLELGEEETDVSVVHLDETKEKQANVAMNKIEGEFDEEKLHDLFAELDTDDIFSTGFTEAELHSIFPEGEEDGETESGADDEDDKTGEGGAEDGEPVGGEFTVFLSFPTKAAAEEWLAAEGIEPEFSAGRNMIIRMEGQEYGN